MMSEKRFKLLSGGFDEEGNPLYRIDTTDMLGNYEICKKVIEQQAIIRRDEMSIKTMMSNMEKLEKENEDLREVNKENQLLHEENVKQCERWKNLYELKDAEVTARVDALNRVCEYYTSGVLFKSDVDPNKAVREVINEILNTEVEMW